MKKLKNTQFLVTAALLAALTFIATSVFKFPTPTLGYVHIGDSFVLLSGFLLGPVAGGLAAGIGSMLSDLLGGYAAWAPGTFIIKFFTAFTAGTLFFAFRKKGHDAIKPPYSVLAGIAGETVMILGYFVYNIIMMTLINTSADNATLYGAAAESLSEIPFNAVQEFLGIVISSLLIPILSKITAGNDLIINSAAEEKSKR